MKKSLKILSYNIHKGFDLWGRTFVLEKIREAICSLRADLVFLQEVQGDHQRHRKKISHYPLTSQFEYLADQTWHHYAYGKNSVYDEGHHGNAILSKFPILHWDNIDISRYRFEKRGILHARIGVPGVSTPLHAVCLHLNLLQVHRKKQIEVLCSRIEEHVPHDEALIVAGDFNDWREQATKMLAQRVGLTEAFLALKGEHPRTFPAGRPMLRLDRIYFRGVEVQEAHCLSGAPWSSLSDHVPVSARFGL